MSDALTETTEQRIRSLAISLREQGAPATIDDIATQLRVAVLVILDPTVGGMIRRIRDRLG